MAASAIPVIGPFAAILGGAGAEAAVDWLRGFLSRSDLDLYLDPSQRLTSDFLKDLVTVGVRQRLVLMIDTYEQMTTLDDWVQELASLVPDNVLLVIASRVAPAWDRDWPGWMGRAEIIELKEMTEEHLAALVARYYAHIRRGEPDPQQVETIVQFARGLPIAATTVVQLWIRYGVEDFQAVRPQVVADLADRLMEGVPVEMRPAFEAAAVLRYFNVDSLKAMLVAYDVEDGVRGIPPNVNDRLQTALLNCGPFESDSELRAIFIDARINPWRNKLPVADSPIDRVRATIDFLYAQYTDNQENALVLLLRVLCDQIDPHDACHMELAELARELERGITRPTIADVESGQQAIQIRSQDLDMPDAEALYAELRRWPFIRPRREDLAVHDTMRVVINEALQVRAPKQFRALHQRAATHYEVLLARATGEEVEKLELEWLHHCIQTDEERGIRLFQEAAEEFTRHRLINRLRTLLNDLKKYSLHLTTSQLWLDYYTSRLAHLELRLAEAEKAYQTIIQNKQAEPKLRAYALCSLGQILSRWQRLGDSGDIDRVANIFEQSLALAPLDVYLVEAITGLAHVHRFRGQWDKAMMYAQQAYEFFKGRGDKLGEIDSCRILKMHHSARGEWKEMLGTHELVKDALSALPEGSYFGAKFLGVSVWAWAHAGRYTEAEHNSEAFLGAAQRLDDLHSVYWAHMQLGLLLTKQQRYRDADYHLSESLKIVQSLGEDYETHRSYIESWWGMLLMKQGKWEQAQEKLM